MTPQRETSTQHGQRGNRLWLYVGCVILALILIPIAGVIVFVARFSPNSYAPAITQAVSRALNRQLALGSPITLHLSLTPTLTASNISLSNPPGFQDGDFATIGRVEARFALLPLLSHRLDILSLTLKNPVITLERASSGAADWDFTPQPSQQAATSTPIPATKSGWQVTLESVEIDDGSLTIKNQNAPPTIIHLTNFTGQADSPSAPLHLSAQAAINQTPFRLTGAVGPIARFTGIGSGPWPVNLNLSAAGATSSITGSIAEPRAGRGYNLAANLSIPALEALNAILPDETLPAIHAIAASAQLSDQNATLPAISNFKLTAGASDLSGLWPGLSLAKLNVQNASLTSSLTFSLSGQLGNNPVNLQGTLGAPDSFLPAAWLPQGMAPGNFPVALTGQLGNAQLSVNGGIATPSTFTGTALALTINIPDLSTLSPAVSAPLPAWKNIAAKATLTDPGGAGLLNAVSLDGIDVTMSNAAFGGDASLAFKPRQLQLSLDFSQANVDNLLAAWPQPQARPTSPQLLSTAPDGRLVPATPLPLGLLKGGNADVQLSADSVVWNRISYTALQAHAKLVNGILTISPLTGMLPGGSVSADLSIDATHEPATETLQANAPALALAPLLHAFSLPDDAQGTVQARLTANSDGDDLRTIEAGLSGQFGVAGVNGTVSGALLSRVFGGMLQSAGLPVTLAGMQGPVVVRCLAARIDAMNGMGTVRTLTLDSSRLSLQGSGTIDFGQEQFGIMLSPQARIGNTNVAIPVKLGGSFLAPSFAAAPGAMAQSAAEFAAGAEQNTLLGKLGSLLGRGQIAPAQTDTCPPALALARMGQTGFSPAPLNAPGTSLSVAPTPGLTPKNLLNTLLGQ